ncbi:MAG: ParB/RepB/Spo0J family partition protein [Candidatus Woesearchaeota archaeon]
MIQELKEIPTNNILANFSQPRETFNKEQIKELAESILSNGLINPITVREWKGKYMIVAGERRWRAHNVAGLKTIQAFVKEYENDEQMMIESLIENVHREDLTEYEKAKYLKRIMDVKKIKNMSELARIINLSHSTVSALMDLMDVSRKHLSESVQKGEITEHHFRVIKKIENKEEAKKVLKKIKKDKLSSTQTERFVPIFRQSTPEIKKALLNDEINVDQAERISKLKPEQRAKAIQEHKNISRVEKGVERNIKNQEPVKEKREFDKRLLQAGNWIASFRGSVTDSYKSLEKTIKVLLISTQFINVMDEKQKEKLEEQLNRFLEILNKAKQLSEQIEEKIK